MANRSPLGPAIAALVLLSINIGLLTWAAVAGAWVAYPTIPLGVVIFVLLGVAARRATAAERLARATPEGDHRSPPRPH
jgi:fatty acid desaturase